MENLCDSCIFRLDFPECTLEELVFECELEEGDPCSDAVVQCGGYAK